MNEHLLSLAMVSLAIVSPACCFTPTPAPVAPPVTAPPTPITTMPGSSMEACHQLCEHFGQCLDARGAPRTPETADCAQACAVGHTYASLPPQAYVCLNQPTCRIFESCLNAAIGAAIAGMPPGGIPTSGLPSGGPPLPTGLPTSGLPSGATAGAPPTNWPEGFPVVPGGIPVEAPPAGPVRVALLMYSIDAAQLDTQYHDALSAAGWTATATEAGPEARRFTATRGGASVSVSILGFEGGATIQTMQF